MPEVDNSSARFLSIHMKTPQLVNDSMENLLTDMSRTSGNVGLRQVPSGVRMYLTTVFMKDVGEAVQDTITTATVGTSFLNPLAMRNRPTAPTEQRGKKLVIIWKFDGGLKVRHNMSCGVFLLT